MDINIDLEQLKEKLNSFITKIKDSGKIKNKIVLGIDNEKSIITIYNISSSDSLVSIFTVPFPYQTLLEDYSKCIENIVVEYIMPKYDLKVVALYIMFPNEAVAFDMMTIPVVNKQKMKEALNMMISTNYKNVNDLISKAEPLIIEKTKYIYEVSFIRRDVISYLMNGLSMNKVYPKSITYTANALNAGAIKLYPKLKEKSFIFLDIKNDKTNIVLTYKGRTIGFYTFNFGSSILDANRLYDLKDLFDHSFALDLIEGFSNKPKPKEKEIKEEEKNKDRKYNAISERKNISSNYSYEDLERLKLKVNVKEENFKVFLKIYYFLNRTYKEKNEKYVFDNAVINIDSKYNDLINKELEGEENIIIFRDIVDYKDVIINNLELYGAVFTLEQHKNIID